MSEVNFGTSKKENAESFSFRTFIVVVIIGVATIALSVPLGKKWNPGEMVPDLGVAVITVALIELLVLRVLRQLALRRTKLELETERMLKDIEQFRLKLEKDAREWEEKMHNFTLESIESKLDIVKDELDYLTKYMNDETKEIRVKLDPVYARVIERVEDQKKQHEQENKNDGYVYAPPNNSFKPTALSVPLPNLVARDKVV